MPSKQTVVLIACNICALAAFVLLHRVALGTPHLPTSAPQNAATDGVEGSGHWPELVPDMLVQAPLFSPSRSRPKASVPADALASPPPQPPRLAGIVGAGGRARLALLESEAADRKLVPRGGVFGEWRVISIAPDAVRLRQETSSSADASPPADITIQLRPPIAGSGLPPNE